MTIQTEAEFNRYSISLRDFESASEYAGLAAMRRKNDYIKEALLMATIISYARPFSPNQHKTDIKDATSRLSIDTFIGLTNEQQALHGELIELRNKAIAHSEYARNPTLRDSTTNIISSMPFSLYAQPIIYGLKTQIIPLIDKLKNDVHLTRAEYIFRQKRIAKS